MRARGRTLIGRMKRRVKIKGLSLKDIGRAISKGGQKGQIWKGEQKRVGRVNSKEIWRLYLAGWAAGWAAGWEAKSPFGRVSSRVKSIVILWKGEQQGEKQSQPLEGWAAGWAEGWEAKSSFGRVSSRVKSKVILWKGEQQGEQQGEKQSQPLEGWAAGWAEGWKAKSTFGRVSSRVSSRVKSKKSPFGRVKSRIGRVKSKKSSKSFMKTVKIHIFGQKTRSKIPGWTLFKIQNLTASLRMS